MASETHYTAVVEILYTLAPESARIPSLRSASDVEASARGVDRKREVARLVIRDDSIDGLIAKVTSHLELIKD